VSDEDLRRAERRFALGVPLERREDRAVALACIEAETAALVRDGLAGYDLTHPGFGYYSRVDSLAAALETTARTRLQRRGRSRSPWARSCSGTPSTSS
jgi:hypothetical protein